jgi:hypothetical protein
MEILKKTGIDWHERRLISKLCMDQRVKLWLDKGVTKSAKIGRGVKQGCCLSPLLFNLHGEHVTQEALEGLGDFKVEGQIISMVSYADDLVLLAIGTRRRGRRHKQLLDDLKEARGYWKLKEEAQDHTLWKNQFGRGYGSVARQTTT